MTVGTFFEDVAGPGLKRDRTGRPLLLPRGVTDEQLRQPYTRASALADEIADQRHIHTWEKRYLARGLGLRPDIAALCSVETYNTGLDLVEIGENRASGKRLDSHIERAFDHVKLHEKADYGTAVHALTEPGHPNPPATPALEADVQVFGRTIDARRLKIIGTEIFTANDAVMAAGTFDHLVDDPELGIVIADKKTGRLNGGEFGIQLSVYANADIYNPDTDERMTLEDYVALKGFDPARINRSAGIVMHIPALQRRCDLYKVDLAKGWKGARLCAAARDYHKEDLLEKIVVEDHHAKISDMIRRARSLEHLVAIWQDNRLHWTDALNEIAGARRKELT